MESIIVEGGRPLEGKVSVSGAKNSVLPLLAAAIFFRPRRQSHRATPGGGLHFFPGRLSAY